MPDRIQLKQIAPTVNTNTMNENLGWTPNLDSFFYFVQKIAWGRTFGSPSPGRPCCPLYHSPKPQIHCAGRGGDVDLNDKTKKPLWFSSKVDYRKFKCASYASMDYNVDLIRKRGSENHVHLRSPRAKRRRSQRNWLIELTVTSFCNFTDQNKMLLCIEWPATFPENVWEYIDIDLLPPIRWSPIPNNVVLVLMDSVMKTWRCWVNSIY